MAGVIQQFDVCIVCALYEEAKAVLDEIATRCTVSFAQAFSHTDSYEYRYTAIHNKKGESLTILVTWLADSGPVRTGLDLKPLLQEFHPRFAAMAGFCAGYKGKVRLGDLVVAQYAYHYEEGKILMGSDGQPKHVPEMKTYDATAQVIHYVKGFEAWKEPVTELKRSKLNRRELKDSEQPKCYVAPMASGMAVRGDNPFPWLAEYRNRKTLALDMEAAAFYLTLRRFPEIHALVVKGICDYADITKNDTYHSYAARVSAVYLLSFIQTYITEETMPRKPPFLSDNHLLPENTAMNEGSSISPIDKQVAEEKLDDSERKGHTQGLRRFVEGLFQPAASKDLNERQSNPQRPLRLFLSYTRKDRHWLERLKEYLTILVQQGYLQTWDDAQIQPGDLWRETINVNLLNSDIALFLVTPDFLGSDYAFSVETRMVLRRLKENKVTAIPVILSSADWRNSPLVELKPLPRNGQPLSEWANPEAGFLDIVEGIRDICQKLMTKQSSSIQRAFSLQERLKFNEVFLKSGTPVYTFVEYADFKRLKFAIAEPGRGVVIEGPSGIGKTTAVKRALEEIVFLSQTQLSNTSVRVLSARSPQQLKQIQTLQDWHQGTLVIDDFHRLDETLRRYVVDYLKYLADTESESKKLVIVGIPYTRHKLVQLSFDLATRIDVFSLSRVSDYDIQTMIEKGEKALNISFDQKAEIVRAASGSLNLAQFICNTICSTEEIVETQVQQRWVSCDIKTVVASVMADLSTKFDETLHKFARLGGQRNSIALRLLEELARCEDGFLSLSVLKNQRPDLALGIDRFIKEKWIDDLYHEYPVSKYQLFFDQVGTTLIADDPQLIFYLNKTRFSQLAKETGKVPSLAQCRVFICYSHHDIQWLSRLQVHLKPLEQEGLIDLWADTRITADTGSPYFGAMWRDKVQKALDAAKIALVLVSADFLASDFVIKHELPKLLSNASSSGTIIIPLIISPCLFGKSKLAVFQSVNSPDNPLTSLDYHAQELVLTRVAEVVSDYLENGDA